MRKHPLRVVIATMVVSYALVALTVVLDRTPNLGLDLQGGVAVNLQPVKEGEVTDDVTGEQLDQAIEIIRNRVDALGVAEPEVTRQGTTILVQLPGAEDQQDVLDVLVTTATMQFRPVLQIVGTTLSGDERTEAEARVTELRAALAVPEGVSAQQVVADEEANAAPTVPDAVPAPPPGEGGDPTATTAAPPTTAAPGTTIDPTEGGGGGGRSFRVPAAPGQDDGGATTTTAPESTTTTTVPPTPVNQWGVNVYDERFGELYQLEAQLQAETTPDEEVRDDAEVTLPGRDGTLYRLGPSRLSGRAIDTATSGIGADGQWTVSPVFRGGRNGIDRFNAVAADCFNGAPSCPAQAGGRGQLAIVLDNEVLSAPSINEASFARDQISISGSFTEEEARNLATSLRFGALPVDLRPQQAETVSATLGKGALQAGIIAGLIGLALASVYMFLYYRLLAVVAIGSLTISAAALWVIMAFVGATVTLAGVVGIVVSVGITVDSTVVYFESLKERVRAGSSVSAAVDRSFTTAYSTIVKANVASLIGAGVLYWLAVGPVRGFAFYLGAMTLLNLAATYLFVHPATAALARSSLAGRPERLGIPVDDLAPAAAASAPAAGDAASPVIGARR